MFSVAESILAKYMISFASSKNWECIRNVFGKMHCIQEHEVCLVWLEIVLVEYIGLCHPPFFRSRCF